jgi:hypothetical protein
MSISNTTTKGLTWRLKSDKSLLLEILIIMISKWAIQKGSKWTSSKKWRESCLAKGAPQKEGQRCSVINSIRQGSELDLKLQGEAQLLPRTID